MRNGKNQTKSLGEEVSEVSVQMGTKTERKIMKTYRIEASTTNPETRQGYERNNLSDYTIMTRIETASAQAKSYWRNGYWVEIYNNDTEELLFGPYDPDEMKPPIFLG